MATKLDRSRFYCQRNSAKRRNIDFLLTFDEWLTWWKNTGHYHERGCKRTQYCMSRFNDTGPYSLTNIKCITHSQNRLEAAARKSEQTRMAALGKAMSYKIAGKNKRKCLVNGVEYLSLTLAAEANGLTASVVHYRINKGKGGYSYV